MITAMQAVLYLVFTPARCRGEPWQTLREAVRGGVDLVQWRAKDGDREGARRCLLICRELEVPMIVNDDAALAVELGADGAHLGQEDLPADQARALLGTEMLLGVSTHDLEQIAAAEAAGADYLGFGPVFPTETKGYTEGQPRGALRAAVRATELPIFAIGGIDPGRVGQVRTEGCTRVAVCRSILAAADPGAVARDLRRALESRF